MRNKNLKDLSDVNPELGKKIVSIGEEGNRFARNKDYTAAIGNYKKAWELLPEPKLEWEPHSMWLSSSFYDAYLALKDYKKAEFWAQNRLKAVSSDIDTGPYTDLGMVYYELGQYDKAYEYFDIAYQGGQTRAFKERPKKYLNFYLKEAKNKRILTRDFINKEH